MVMQDETERFEGILRFINLNSPNINYGITDSVLNLLIIFLIKKLKNGYEVSPKVSSSLIESIEKLNVLNRRKLFSLNIYLAFAMVSMNSEDVNFTSDFLKNGIAGINQKYLSKKASYVQKKLMSFIKRHKLDIKI